MRKSILLEKSFEFAKRIVRMAAHISDKKREFVLTKQCLRSGTSIGALVREGHYAQSRADFVNKMSIALKEANETAYWLQLLEATGYLEREAYHSISKDTDEIIKLLTATVKTAKKVPAPNN